MTCGCGRGLAPVAVKETHHHARHEAANRTERHATWAVAALTAGAGVLTWIRMYETRYPGPAATVTLSSIAHPVALTADCMLRDDPADADNVVRVGRAG